MSALTSVEIIAIVVVILLSVVIIGVLLFMVRRLRQQREKILGELRDRPQLVQDRAFNRLAMARRESDILARQGTDVTRMRELIAQAQGAFDLRDFDRSYQLAQQAHETLVHARRDASPLPRGPATSPMATATPPLEAVGAPAPTSTTEATAPPRAAIPKNRVESQFQLRLLDQELETARQRRPRSTPTRDATQIRAEATAAFDRGDYTEAFRLALKGRRTLGAEVEGLPPVHVTPGAPAISSDGSAGADLTQTVERVASAERCAECGYPALAGDTFCRGCGQPRTPKTCAECGAPRTPVDTFCGRCGARFT